MKLASAILALSLFGWLSPSCGSARPMVELPPAPAVAKPAAVVTPPKAGETATEARLRESLDMVRRLTGDLATWQAAANAAKVDLESERKEAFLSTLRASCLWVAGLALLAGLACTVAAFLSPIAKPLLVRCALVAGGLVVLATGCAWAVPWLPTLGVLALLAVIACAIAYAVWRVVLWWPAFAQASIAAASGYQKAAAVVWANAPELAEEIDAGNRSLQIDGKRGGAVYQIGNQLHALAGGKP